MEQSKFDKMRADFQKDFEEVKKSFNADLKSKENLINGLTLIYKDMDTQIKSLKQMLFDQGIIDPVKFEVEVDMRRGLRIKGPEEKVENEDVVWVDYKATTGPENKEVVGQDEGMPVRVGSGAIAFEAALIGLKTNETTVFGDDVEVSDQAGKKTKERLEFRITVKKIKTPLKGEQDGRSGHVGAVDQGQSEPKLEAGRSGHEAEQPGNNQPVQ